MRACGERSVKVATLPRSCPEAGLLSPSEGEQTVWGGARRLVQIQCTYCACYGQQDRAESKDTVHAASARRFIAAGIMGASGAARHALT